MAILYTRRIKGISFGCSLLISLCLNSSLQAGQYSGSEIYQIPRIEKSPNIDGTLQPGEWKDAKQIALAFNVNPGDNTPAEVKTTAWLMEDGENFYLAFKAEDPEPEKIRAYLRDRDGIFQDDFVGVILDTFNDERRAFEFFVNPLGAQGDLTRDDTQHREDSSWNATWDSAGTLTESGYQVEMAIPFRVLRYTAVLEQQTWGIQLLRIYPRDARNILSNSPGDRDLDCEICQYNKLTGMPNLQAIGHNIDVTPTLTYVNSESRDVDAGEDWQNVNNDPEVGVDFRWAMTEDWILNATINPDFSQVEADAGQLDINTTFSLFYPEARPFFLDGADYFNTRNRLVHTRNIADPSFGVKVTGKSKGITAGTIIARDDTTSFLLPGNQGSDFVSLDEMQSDIFVGRAQIDIGDKSNIGALFTSRSGDGYSNHLLSVDGSYSLSKANTIDFQLMHSESKNPLSVQQDYGVADTQNGSAYWVNFQRNTENYSLFASQQSFDTDFRADMGFIGRVDYKKSAAGGSYRWFGDKDSKWTRWGLFGDWDRTLDQDGNELEEEYELHFNLHGPYQFHTNFGGGTRNEYYDGNNYDVDFQMMWFELQPATGFTVGNFMRFGDQIDFANSQLGKITLFEPYINWQMGRHFNARISSSLQTLDVAGGELFDAKLMDMRLAYQFSIRSRLSLTLQLTDIARNTHLYKDNNDTDPDNDRDANTKSLGTQLIYSYKINPQSLFYLGYSDSAFSNDTIDSLTRSDRTFFAKFSYQWQY